jgi:hypothetical protein
MTRLDEAVGDVDLKLGGEHCCRLARAQTADHVLLAAMNLPLLAALLIPLLRRGVSAVDEFERALAREDRLLPIFILSSISVRTWVNY